MLGFKENGKSHFMIGMFYVIDVDSADFSSGYIIKNEDTYNHIAGHSEENKQILDKLDLMKSERPFEWGVYEDWRKAVDLGYTKVTEAVARQYQELDYILTKMKDAGDALYMLNRIETSYKNFLITRRSKGDVAAHNYLNRYRLQGQDEHRMTAYYDRLLQRVMSDIPLCTGFFQDDQSHLYVSALTKSQGFMKGARMKAEAVTIDDIFLEYLKTNEEDPESLELLQSPPKEETEEAIA